MGVHPVCWVALVLSGLGIGVLGLFLRMLWDRLTIMEQRHAACERKLNEVETKLLMLETAQVP